MLPDQERKDIYTESEMQHAVAREVMKHRLDDMEANIKRHSENSDLMFSKIFGKIDEALIEIRRLVEKSALDIEKCRDDLRREIKATYATQTELENLRGELKILSTKIITAMSVIMVVIQFASDFLK